MQPQQSEDEKKKTEGKLRETSSVAAIEQKRSLVAEHAVAVVPPPNKTTFTVVDLQAINALISRLKCKTYSGDAEIRRGERVYGLAVKLLLVCVNCGDVSSEWSLPHVDGDQKINPFTANLLGARAMQATSNRQTASNSVFATMNISYHGLHTKTWQAYVKKKLAPASKLTSEHTSSFRYYAELNLNNPGNIAVSYDGSWMTRGHSSHISW